MRTRLSIAVTLLPQIFGGSASVGGIPSIAKYSTLRRGRIGRQSNSTEENKKQKREDGEVSVDIGAAQTHGRVERFGEWRKAREPRNLLTE